MVLYVVGHGERCFNQMSQWRKIIFLMVAMSAEHTMITL